MGWRSGQSYSADLRERVLATIDTGLPTARVAERFDVSISFIYKALKRRRLTGETTARAQCNQQALKLAAHHEAIRVEVERRPDVTLEELRRWLVETHGVEASLGLMHNTLIRLGLSLKKRPDGQRSRIGPTSPSGAPPGAPSKA
jgi:transposase